MALQGFNFASVHTVTEDAVTFQTTSAVRNGSVAKAWSSGTVEAMYDYVSVDDDGGVSFDSTDVDGGDMTPMCGGRVPVGARLLYIRLIAKGTGGGSSSSQVALTQMPVNKITVNGIQETLNSPSALQPPDYLTVDTDEGLAAGSAEAFGSYANGHQFGPDDEAAGIAWENVEHEPTSSTYLPTPREGSGYPWQFFLRFTGSSNLQWTVSGGQVGMSVYFIKGG